MKLTDEQRRVLDNMADWPREDEMPALVQAVDAALARIDELEAMAQDMCFNCPSCGRHDFGVMGPLIAKACGPCRQRAETAEAENTRLRAEIETAKEALNYDSHADDRTKARAADAANEVLWAARTAEKP